MEREGAHELSESRGNWTLHILETTPGLCTLSSQNCLQVFLRSSREDLELAAQAEGSVAA